MIKKAFLSLILTLTSCIGTPLSLDEKIGQMIVVALVTNPDHNKDFMAISPYHLDPSYAKQMIKEFHIGGVLCMGKSIPAEQVALVNELQALSKHPLLVLQDAEWGLSMRMSDVLVYPKAMTLGALSSPDNPLIYTCGCMIGSQLRALGIHSSLSPICDVNSNPANPIINTRSFGQNPYDVATKATLMMQGLADGATLPCAKHFPGHGNTSTDSHHALPYISATKEELTATELIPFYALIKAGIPAVMMAHLDVPSLTQQPTVPTSLSKAAIAMLRHAMQFDELIMPDGLGMRGITEGRDQRAIAIEAILAGNDLLLCPIEVPETIATIKQAVIDGIITEKMIDEHVERIIRAKQLLAIERTIIYDAQKLMTPEALELKKQLYTAAITVARNEDNRLPINATQKPIDVIAIGASSDASFITTLQDHLPITCHILPIDATQEMCIQLAQKLQDRSPLIISLHLPSRSGMIEMHQETTMTALPPYVSFINNCENKVILVLFGNPYNLAHLQTTGATIIAYENEPEAQHAAALTIVGKHNPRGKLPVTASEQYLVGLSYSYHTKDQI